MAYLLPESVEVGHEALHRHLGVDGRREACRCWCSLEHLVDNTLDLGTKYNEFVLANIRTFLR